MHLFSSCSALRSHPVPAHALRQPSVTGISTMIHIVDDDAGVRAALSFLLTTAGMDSRAYASAEEFLDQATPGVRDCLIVDLQMPRMGGAELLQVLAQRGVYLPSIVITAHPDHAAALQPLRDKPVAVLSKPFRDEVLLRTIEGAVGPDGGMPGPR